MKIAALIIPILLVAASAGCVAPEARVAGGAPLEAADPGQFVDQLYDRYRGHPVEGRRPPWGGPRWQDESVYTPEILALLAREAALAGDEVPEHGDGDHICQCQDWGNLRLLERTVRATGEGRAETSVRFENFGESRNVRLVLERTVSGWRVADLFDNFYPEGLVASLRESIARADLARRDR